jgi:two-component system nitrogen regulation sensor histidine kinase GlnL
MTFIAETTARVYDNLATAVLLFDNQLRLTSVNAAGENLLYVSNRQMTGLKPDEILPDSRVFDAVLKRTLKTSAPFTERGMVLQLPHKEEITVDCCVTPVMEEDDCVEIIVFVVWPMKSEIHWGEFGVPHSYCKLSWRTS